MMKGIILFIITTCAVFGSVGQALSLTLCKNNDDRDIFIKTIKCPTGYEVHKNSSIKLSKESLNIDFYKLDIHNIFRLISEVSGVDILVNGTIKDSVTLKANEIGIDELITRLIIQYDLAVEVKEGFISVGRRENIYETKVSKEVDERPYQTHSKRNTNNNNIWSERWQVDFQHTSIRDFVAELNLRTGKNIEVATDVNGSFSMTGAASTQKIFKTVLSKTGLKLIAENGKYKLVGKGIVSKHPKSSAKTIHNMICDVYMHNGKSYLQYLVNEKKDKSITVSKRGLSVNYPYGQVRLVDNCSQRKLAKNAVVQKNSGVNRQDNTEYVHGSSSNKKPRGSVVLNPFHDDTSTVWQLYTPSNSDIISGYYGYWESKTGKVIGGRQDDTVKGSLDPQTGYITVEYYYYEYRSIKVGLRKRTKIFKIVGTKVVDEQGEVIGKFKPNKYLLNQNFNR